MKKKTLSRIQFAVLALLGTATLVFAYNFTGLDWNWQNDPCEDVVYINPNCQDAEAGSPEVQIFSLIKGLDAWTNEGESSFEFRYGGVTEETGGPWNADGMNVVFFSPDDGGDVIATTYYHTTAGEMVEFDVKYWDGGWVFHGGVDTPPVGTDFDIWDIASHEFGHALGLDHTWQFQATMYAYANLRQTKSRDLWDDDINGIQALYGTPDVNLRMTPAEQLTVVPAGGGSFEYSVRIRNNTGGARTRTFWIDVTLPNGNVFGPVDGPVTVAVPPGANWNLQGFVQDVPDFAPAGVYAYQLKSSTSFHGNVRSMTEFPFIKDSSMAGMVPSGIADWSRAGLETIDAR
jgi:hypothetical protein